MITKNGRVFQSEDLASKWERIVAFSSPAYADGCISEDDPLFHKEGEFQPVFLCRADEYAAGRGTCKQVRITAAPNGWDSIRSVAEERLANGSNWSGTTAFYALEPGYYELHVAVTGVDRNKYTAIFKGYAFPLRLSI